jgi:hypothetical protein
VIIKKILRRSKNVGWKGLAADRLLKYLLTQNGSSRVLGRPIVELLVQGKIRRQGEEAWRKDIVRALVSYVKRVRRRRPTKDYFAHFAISFSPEDSLKLGKDSGARFRRIEKNLRELIQEMGFENRPWIAVAHADKEHLHVHLIACLYDHTGRAVRISWDAYHYKMLSAVAERVMGLTMAHSEDELNAASQRRRSARAQLTTGEIRAEQQCGEPSVRQKLQSTLDKVLIKAQSLSEFARECQAEGIRVIPRIKGNKVEGLTYKLGIDRMRASELGAQYQWPKLIMRYQVENDVEEEGKVISHWRANLANERQLDAGFIKNVIDFEFEGEPQNWYRRLMKKIKPLRVVLENEEIHYFWPNGKLAFRLMRIDAPAAPLVAAKLVFEHMSSQAINLAKKVLQSVGAKIKRFLGPNRKEIEGKFFALPSSVRDQSSDLKVNPKLSHPPDLPKASKRRSPG